MTRDDFWENRFHWCALAAGFVAAAEGRLDDDEYLKKLAYEFYETGAFRDRLASSVSASSHSPLGRPNGLSGSGS